MKAWAVSWLICSVLHRTNDAHLVGDAADVRKEIGDFQTGLVPTGETWQTTCRATSLVTLQLRQAADRQ